MAISARMIQNKHTTGIPSLVYDVNLKYRSEGSRKTYSKKGFKTESLAREHELEMKCNFSDPTFVAKLASRKDKNLTIWQFTTIWLENQVKLENRQRTYEGYRSNMQVHVLPHLGDILLNELSGTHLDRLYEKLREEGISDTSIHNVHKTISTALTYGRKSGFIEKNVAKDTFSVLTPNKTEKTMYTLEELRMFFDGLKENENRIAYVLAGLYGLRIGEVLGLRSHNVNLEEKSFTVIEQLPYHLSRKTTLVVDFSPVKSGVRTLPITDCTLLFFQEAMEQSTQKEYQNHLLVSRPDGRPIDRATLNSDFKLFQKEFGLHSIRFHDLRHSVATHIYNITGDFFGVSKILGHSVSGASEELGVSSRIQTTTDQYAHASSDSLELLLRRYHMAVL